MFIYCLPIWLNFLDKKRHCCFNFGRFCHCCSSQIIDACCVAKGRVFGVFLSPRRRRASCFSRSGNIARYLALDWILLFGAIWWSHLVTLSTLDVLLDHSEENSRQQTHCDVFDRILRSWLFLTLELFGSCFFRTCCRLRRFLMNFYPVDAWVGPPRILSHDGSFLTS